MGDEFSNEVDTILGTPSNNLIVRVEKGRQRPEAIVVISTLFFVGAFVLLIFGVAFLFISYIFNSIIGIEGAIEQATTIKSFANASNIFFILFLIAFAVNVVIGIGLWKMKNWARVLAVAYSVLLMFTLIWIPFGAVLIYFLARGKTKEAFTKDYNSNI